MSWDKKTNMGLPSRPVSNPHVLIAWSSFFFTRWLKNTYRQISQRIKNRNLVRFCCLNLRNPNHWALNSSPSLFFVGNASLLTCLIHFFCFFCNSLLNWSNYFHQWRCNCCLIMIFCLKLNYLFKFFGHSFSESTGFVFQQCRHERKELRFHRLYTWKDSSYLF